MSVPESADAYRIEKRFTDDHHKLKGILQFGHDSLLEGLIADISLSGFLFKFQTHQEKEIPQNQRVHFFIEYNLTVMITGKGVISRLTKNGNYIEALAIRINEMDFQNKDKLQKVLSLL